MCCMALLWFLTPGLAVLAAVTPAQGLAALGIVCAAFVKGVTGMGFPVLGAPIEHLWSGHMMERVGVMYRIILLWCVVLACVALGCSISPGRVSAAPPTCVPTRADSLGPFYEPNAPERDHTGQALVISGTVRSARDCSPLGGAVIEWWSANPRGDYDNAHRATQRVSADGSYQYTTDFPGMYPGRPPHVHVRVTAPGHRTLVTQVYPQQAQTALNVDLVLAPK